MTDELTLSFINLFRQIDFPISETFSEESAAFFEYGNDILLMYRGNPTQLYHAVQVYWQANNLPYACAGAANVLVSASYISRNNFSREGLYHADLLITKAMNLAPDRYEIECIQANILSAKKDTSGLRAALKKLGRFSEARTLSNYATLQMFYWNDEGDLDNVRQWYQRALDRAENEVRRVYLISKMAGLLFDKKGHEEEVIRLYRQVVQLDPNDPWAWHNLSLMYLRKNEIDKAGECNRQALDLMPFQVAMDINSNLVSYWQKSQHKDPLKEYPRYISATTLDSNEKPSRWFRK